LRNLEKLHFGSVLKISITTHSNVLDLKNKKNVFSALHRTLFSAFLFQIMFM